MDHRRKQSATITDTGTLLRIAFGADSIQIHLDDAQQPHNRRRQDYVAWLLLPLAMRQGVDIHIEGRGSATTVRNARLMASIWARWLPGHYSPVQVSFAEDAVDDEAGSNNGDLCLYSGGIDSTYALLKRINAGHQQDLLTIHGMDYRYADEGRFADLLSKTAPFAALVAKRRLLIRTDAYDAYKKHRVNPKGCDVGHVFVLAAATFLYSESYARAVIAADYRLDQQFDVHPWGTNTATNRYFDDGHYRLHTECEDVTRSEKGPLLLTSAEALASLTFCVDYSARPHNCGKCQKCVRTKALFMAATGTVPDICIDRSLGPDSLAAFDLRKKHQRAFFFDLHDTALRQGSLDKVPGLAGMYASAITHQQRRSPWQKLKSAFAKR